jgi:dienelactone hydrolase
MLVRANEPGRHPLVLIKHGTPGDASERAEMTPFQFFLPAIEFVQRGWTAAIVMRRGYGDSGGGYAESRGPCSDPDYVRVASESAADLSATVESLAKRPDIEASRILSVGQSSGGLATVALTAEPPPGLVAAISFAGGRGSDQPDSVCREDKLIAVFGELGKRSRVPMLWVYSENDHSFGPALAEKFREAFTTAGGKVTLMIAPPFGTDGHTLFSSVPQWAPWVDGFLTAQNLVQRSTLLPPPAPPSILPPQQLSSSGRNAFTQFLASAPHKAFALSASGVFGWVDARRTIEAAKAVALGDCRSADCLIIVVDDTPLP